MGLCSPDPLPGLYPKSHCRLVPKLPIAKSNKNSTYIPFLCSGIKSTYVSSGISSKQHYKTVKSAVILEDTTMQLRNFYTVPKRPQITELLS